MTTQILVIVHPLSAIAPHVFFTIGHPTLFISFDMVIGQKNMGL
jgi:hypothetical protein